MSFRKADGIENQSVVQQKSKQTHSEADHMDLCDLLLC